MCCALEHVDAKHASTTAESPLRHIEEGVLLPVVVELLLSHALQVALDDVVKVNVQRAVHAREVAPHDGSFMRIVEHCLNKLWWICGLATTTGWV